MNSNQKFSIVKSSLIERMDALYEYDRVPVSVPMKNGFEIHEVGSGTYSFNSNLTKNEA